MYTVADIAGNVEAAHGINPQVAYESALTYLAQIERIDDVTLDPEDLDRETYLFILESIAAGIAGGDIY